MVQSPFHTNALGVSAFLGGTTFAAMVLLIEVKDSVGFTHPNWLITGTAITSILFIMSTVGMMHIAVNNNLKNSTFTKTMEWFSNIGFFGLLTIIPLLVFQFTFVGGVAVSVITIGTFVILSVLRVKDG